VPDVSFGEASKLRPGRISEAKLGRRLLLLAVGLTFLSYLATLHFGFVYDDLPQIIGNRTLTSWRYLPSLFLGHTWKFLLPDWPGNYYRPIFMSWLLLNRMLWGLNPMPWHACALALHLIATSMTFVVARQVLDNDIEAGVVAVLFGLHPIHIESVAWISGATDPLMAIFVLAAFWAWIRGGRAHLYSSAWRWIAAVLYLLACLTKETAVPLPIVVIAFDRLFNKKGFFQSVRQSWSLWIAAVVYLTARTLALHGFEHPLGLPLRQIQLTTPAIIWGYMRLLIWPVGLSVFYDTPPVASIVDARFWLPLILGIAALAAAFWASRRSHVCAFSCVWIGSFLAPAILGLPLFHVGEWLHDRYLYLPSFGFCLLLGHVLFRAWESQVPLLKRGSVALSVVLAAGMCFATTWQEQPWANSLFLFTHSAAQQPTSAWAKGYLAAELLRRGDRDDAARTYEEALKLDPHNWRNHCDYGKLLYDEGQYRRADEMFTRALAIDPRDGNTHFIQGLSRFNDGDFAAAESSFSEALRRNANLPQVHYMLGYLFELEGKITAARAEYIVEIQSHPETAKSAQEHLSRLEAK